MKRKCVSFVMMLVMALLCATLLTSAAVPDASFELDTATGNPGDTVTLHLTMDSTVEIGSLGISGFDYDKDVFEFVSFSDYGTVITGSLLGSLGVDASKETISLGYNPAQTLSGSICSVTFKIKDTAAVGTYDIGYIVVINNGKITDYTVKAGSLTVSDEVPSSTIKCAQVALGTDISVNYYVDLLAADEGAQMRFTMNGKETLVDGTFDEEYGLYVFPFTGITPQCMGDTIKAELVKDGETLDVKDDYSVLQNCKNLLGKTAEDLGLTDDQYDAMETLIADLMEYGAAAQVYRGYKADTPDSLMNADETIAALTPTEFVKWEGEDAEAVCSYLDDPTSDTMYIYAAGVYFDYCNSVYIKFHAEDITAADFCVTTDAEDAWYRLDDEAHPIIPLDEEDNYLVVFEPVPAFEFGDDEIYYDIAINTVKKDKKGVEKATLVQELYYSIPAYVFSKQDETTPMADLAKALYNYGLSAANYMAAIEK